MSDQRDQSGKLTEILDRFAGIEPDARWRAELKTKLLTRGRELAPTPARPRFSAARRVAALAAALLFSSSGVVYAASGAMPDSPLYPVKKAAEKASLLVTAGETEAGLKKTFAAKRFSESRYLLKRSRAADRSRAIKLLDEARANGDTGLKTKVDELLRQVGPAAEERQGKGKKPKLSPYGRGRTRPNAVPETEQRRRGKQEGRVPIGPGV